MEHYIDEHLEKKGSSRIKEKAAAEQDLKHPPQQTNRIGLIRLAQLG
jgi:hypothetical protein